MHVLWDFPEDSDLRQLALEAERLGVRIGSINPNVFQDQCYKFGSVCNRDPSVRQRAVQHLLDSVKIAEAGRFEPAKASGSPMAPTTPGRTVFAAVSGGMSAALKAVHQALPDQMKLLLEYKPYEPAFYHTDIADWGMAYVFAKQAGPRAKVLVDTGHHLPGL